MSEQPLIVGKTQADIQRICQLLEKLQAVDHRDPVDWFRQLVDIADTCLVEAHMGNLAWQPDLGQAQDAYPHLIEAFAILLSHAGAEPTYEDLLGSVYMELASRWKKSGLGQFFTPLHVARLMAQVTLGDPDMERYTPERPMTICDPACGSGIMLLAAASVLPRAMIDEGRVAFFGCDVDPLCVAMARLNCRIYRLNGGGSWCKNTRDLTEQEIGRLPEPHRSSIQQTLFGLDESAAA